MILYWMHVFGFHFIAHRVSFNSSMLLQGLSMMTIPTTDQVSVSSLPGMPENQ